ncbi:unnamed protein product [Diabrotica balteata]|uniref:Uncharacterized protein n=1 Tax=Diabrotica balteata TaxID=107213 RepID=A0A9N9T5T4_DIABA|nr:unnamed protein product [Diabrotica balteata]
MITKSFDNKPVIVESNCWYRQLGNCQRWDKKNKKYIDVRQPEAVRLCNQNMGGVDNPTDSVSLVIDIQRA